MRRDVGVFRLEKRYRDFLVVLVLLGLLVGNGFVHEKGHAIIFNDFGCNDVSIGGSLDRGKGLAYCTANCTELSEVEMASMKAAHSLWESVHILFVFFAFCFVVVYNLFDVLK